MINGGKWSAKKGQFVGMRNEVVRMRTGDVGSRAQIVQIHHNLQLNDAGYDHDSADQEISAMYPHFMKRVGNRR